LTIQQAIALAAHNQRLDASKPRSVSVSVEYQQPSFQSQTAAAQGFASRVAGGGMAALMMEQQKAREGDSVVAAIMRAQSPTHLQTLLTHAQAI
jgi:hypothetical protein